MSSDTPRVVLTHPAIRPYRGHIFQRLQRDFRFKLYLLGFEDVNKRWAEYYSLTNHEILTVHWLPGLPSGASLDLASRASRDNYDIWISSGLYGSPTWFTYPIVKRRKKKFVLWTEDWYFGGDRLSRAVTPLVRRVLAGSDLVIASGTKAAELARANGVSDDRIRLAINSHQPIRSRGIADVALRQLVQRKSKPRILYLGRIIPYKGLDLLIRAFKEVRQGIGPNVELMVAGSGPHEAACRSLVKSLGLQDVTFCGRVDPLDVQEVYANADIFVHPCRLMPSKRVKGESWGFVINEAMSLGLPVVTTDAVGSAYDLIEHGVSGFVVRPGQPGQLAEVILSLVQDGRLRRSIGSAARARVESQFRPEMQADRFAQAIKDLL